jgi:hypothetical protein
MKKEIKIKFRYTCVRKNGYVFSEIFTIDDIEKGSVEKWIKMNSVDPICIKRSQFTGIIDKVNNKEIYAGDKIQSGQYTGIVVFDAGCFSLDITSTGTETAYDIGMTPPLYDFTEPTIIGNIHNLNSQTC